MLRDLMCSHPVLLRIRTKAEPGRIPAQTELTWLSHPASCLLSIGSRAVVA